MVLVDFVLIVSIALLCHRIWLATWLPTTNSFVFVEISWLTAMAGLGFAGAYARPALRNPARSLKAVVIGGVAAIASTLVLAFMLHRLHEVSRFWVALTWLVSGLSVTTVHLLVTGFVGRLMRAGYLRERIALVGTGPRAEQALTKLRATKSPTVDVVGVFDDRSSRIPQTFSADDLRGNTDSLITAIRANEVDRVVLTLPWTAEERIIQLVTKLRQTPVRVDLIPHNVIWGFPLDTDRIQDVPIVTVANHRIDVQTGWLKRCEDLAIGSCMLVALAPLLVAVAILVRLDSRGPVLFRQKRLGFNNQIFEVYKFRSMTVDRPADDGAVQATKSDKRITRVGRFIRRTSLDELPQLFNVIEGTMSLVGPRPHALPHNHQFGDIVDEYFARHNVKPGITGWAQIHGFRGETDVPEKMSNRVRCDIHYIQNWSILLDMKIIVLTALRVWSQKTAY